MYVSIYLNTPYSIYFFLTFVLSNCGVFQSLALILLMLLPKLAKLILLKFSLISVLISINKNNYEL